MDETRDLRCTKGEAGDDSELLCLAHLQLPYRSDGKDEDVAVGDNIGHNERLEHKYLVHVFTNALQAPLLINGGAKEDHNECENKRPAEDGGDNSPNPRFQLAREYTIV